MHKILIADNNQKWRDFSKNVLEKSGYEVLLAENISELNLLVENNGYDLILVNAEMMRGDFREPIHHLFFQYPDKPFIVISVPSDNYQAVQETSAAFKAGAKDCVEKPFSGENLLKLIKQLLVEFMPCQTNLQGIQT